MIHDEICTYEVCKLAKDKGFPQGFDYPNFKSKLDYYNHKGELNGNVGDILKLRIKHKPVPKEMKPIIAPTQSLLQRWLREEKGVVIDVVLDWQYNIEAEEIRYQYRIGSKRRMTIGGVQTRGIVCDRYYDTYELALEDALAYSLKNLA